MKHNYLLLSFLLTISYSTFGQLDQFTTILDTFFSAPEKSGFMFFQNGNSIAPDACFEYYKASASDNDNDMVLVNVKTDTFANMTHYKFQQTYKALTVENAGTIEHFDQNGSLVFTNAKHAINLNLSTEPIISTKIIETLLLALPSGTEYAWNDSIAEQGIRYDTKDSSATHYPVPELMIAIDTGIDVRFNIDGNRYRLAYKIKITTVNPYQTTIYYMDANTGAIFRTESTVFNNSGLAEVYGYGVRPIDTEWRGFPNNNYRLYANDATRNIHTKKKTGGQFSSWFTISNVTDNDNHWTTSDLFETTAHYFTSLCWDFYRQRFGLIGMDGLNTEVRVRTEWDVINNASFSNGPGGIPLTQYGRSSTGLSLALEPSIVGHEFTHGVTSFSSGLINSGESASLSESISDIFGTVIQATMLDNGATDWIMGNSIAGTPTRSLIDPKSTSQPDTYLGINWGGSLPTGHTNSGVPNHWFYILTNGASGQNDNFDFYNVSGIGMLKSSWIIYYANQFFLQNASQLTDARAATIQAAEALYGLCSIEYQSTIDAWYAVGIGSKHTCTYTVGIDEKIDEQDVAVYPNPTSASLIIEVPTNSEKEITIYNMQGKLIDSFQNKKLITHIDVSEFATGMYTIHLNIEGAIIIKKLVIK